MIAKFVDGRLDNCNVCLPAFLHLCRTSPQLPLRWALFFLQFGSKAEASGSMLSPLASAVIGMVASVGTNLVLYPLDLVKVKLQGSSTAATLFLSFE